MTSINIAPEKNGHHLQSTNLFTKNQDIVFDETGIKSKLLTLNKPCYVVRVNGKIGFSNQFNPNEQLELLMALPPLTMEQLGDRNFLEFYNVKYAYTAGAMAGGIASEELVIAFGKAGILSCFGAGGLSPERVEAAIKTIQQALPQGPYAFNLLHSPSEPAMERGTVDLYIKYTYLAQPQNRHVVDIAYHILTGTVYLYRIQNLKLQGLELPPRFAQYHPG
ncbi:MAG: hypothetical protein HC836_05575 [Richelia sp. RM2_1_2]|nr:hypothetical protein [Richelia sp. RM2_1_2]